MDDELKLASSDDDLEITDIVRRDLGTDKYVEKVTQVASEEEEEDNDCDDEEENAESHRGTGRPRMRDAHTEGEKVDWSDDDGEWAYDKFRNRKAVKRKRIAANTRKAKAIEKGSILGKRPKNGGNLEKAPANKMRDYGDDSDDELMEYTLPDYLQNRRARFDRRTEVLKQAGLKLPPSYD
ncbi:DNA excision repair protein ERCC-6-like 2, partial [Hypocenomyce scalaris]|nr:DNA excision repair protein ERCC-6-like 2 [Hypocenomyce scalaris]